MNYRTHIVSSLTEVGQPAWDALVAAQDAPNPFLSFAFLHALHESGSASRDTGWQPHYLCLYDGEQLAAGMPLYLKSHSYGEYVFDWAWADAYRRHGHPYYPKLLSAVPFTPVAGPRLMAVDEQSRSALVAALLREQEALQVSSTHVLFPPQEHAALLEQAGYMLRSGVQFHWLNAGYRDVDEFLATLDRRKAKNIRYERRKVAQAGVTLRRLRGRELGEGEWRFFHRCYRETYTAHYSTPYLNLDFFLRIGRDMPDHIMMVLAERDGTPVAASLVIHSADALFGRYWGAVEQVPCLHFEAAYYQPIEFCIEQRIAVFEGGAQGEHKLARGFLPTRTWSAHWLAHPDFADAVANFLRREAGGIDIYLDELDERNPFRKKLAPEG